MSVPHSTGNWADLLDKRVTKFFDDEYSLLPDRVSDLFSVETSSDSFEKWSSGGALGNFTQFAGTVTYQSQAQGYDVTATHIPFANGIQIERELYDDDRHGIWQRKPKALARAAFQARQEHAARVLNQAFSVDTFFYNNTENVALCSDSPSS